MQKLKLQNSGNLTARINIGSIVESKSQIVNKNDFTQSGITKLQVHRDKDSSVTSLKKQIYLNNSIKNRLSPPLPEKQVSGESGMARSSKTSTGCDDTMRAKLVVSKSTRSSTDTKKLMFSKKVITFAQGLKNTANQNNQNVDNQNCAITRCFNAEKTELIKE